LIRAGLIASLCAGGILAAAAGATIGQGSATSDKPLRACVNSKTGAVSLVAAGRRCGHGRRAVTWNIRGKTGAPGPAGAQGEAGTRGSTGAPGDRGARGTFNFDDFDGMACDAGSGASTVDVTYDSNGFARFECG
jgi:Collagen triple helix repeat (20 copies)